MSDYNKSDCFLLSLDPVSGKLVRKVIFSNDDVPTAMPRLSSVLGSEMYVIGKQDRFLAKTKIAVAKIEIKNSMCDTKKIRPIEMRRIIVYETVLRNIFKAFAKTYKVLRKS